ncbi:MAG TPA: serine kinase, partial [Pseudolabrys sp.]|nr:serine kinase [Pseudolabrys sp.]
AWNLINASSRGLLPFARLVGDDRVQVAHRSGRLLVRPAEALAGLIEIYGLGIRTLTFEAVAVVGWIVDLSAADATRHPDGKVAATAVAEVALPRIAVAAGMDPLPVVLAALRTSPAGD